MFSNLFSVPLCEAPCDGDSRSNESVNREIIGSIISYYLEKNLPEKFGVNGIESSFVGPPFSSRSRLILSFLSLINCFTSNFKSYVSYS